MKIGNIIRNPAQEPQTNGLFAAESSNSDDSAEREKLGPDC